MIKCKDFMLTTDEETIFRIVFSSNPNEKEIVILMTKIPSIISVNCKNKNNHCNIAAVLYRHFRKFCILLVSLK